MHNSQFRKIMGNLFQILASCYVRIKIGAIVCCFGFAAEVEVVVVNSFGVRPKNCIIKAFSQVKASDTQPKDFAERFSGGLKGKNIPEGQYDATFECEGIRKRGVVFIEQSSLSAIALLSERKFRSDDFHTPLLIQWNDSVLQDENAYVSLIGLFSNRQYASWLDPARATISIYDLDPGSYVLSVHSTKGRSCVLEVDLYEWTRLWRYQHSACSLKTDRYAHVVGVGERARPKRHPWYEEMKKDLIELEQTALRENMNRSTPMLLSEVPGIRS